MKLNKAKIVMQSSGFLKAEILSLKDLSGDGWYIRFEPSLSYHAISQEDFILEGQRSGYRKFKTIDAAIKTLKDIGFPDAWVRF